jgi:hypothetical protein
MAASYYSICTLDTTIADIVVALTDKSLITENHYQDVNTLIFTSPISTKFIKITVGAVGRTPVVSYGDGHTTSNLTGTVVVFSIPYSTPVAFAYHMIADTTYFALITEAGTNGADDIIAYYGALDSGKEIAFGMYAGGNYAAASYLQCKNITDGLTMYPIVINTSFNDGGVELTQKLMWRDAASGQIMKNGSDPAGTLGVKNISMVNGNLIKSTDYIITNSPMYMYSFGQVRTSLIFNF